MAGIDFGLLLANVETMVQQLPTIVATQGDVVVGIPESVAARQFALITLGDTTPHDTAMGLITVDPEINVYFGYRVGGNERASELAIAELLREIIQAVILDRTLSGASDDPVTVSMSRANEPQYQIIAGTETRLYPVVLTGHQQQEVD